MKKVMTATMVGVIIGGLSLPQAARAGDRGWSTAGKILTGVFIGGLLHDAYAAPPACPPVAVHGRAFYYGRPRHEWRSAAYVVPPLAYYPPVVRYVEPRVITVPATPSTETVWILNSNGSRTPVELRRADGGMYVGPRGEYYLGMPTEAQLRQVYGM